VLPPITVEKVVLCMEPMQRLTYNVLASLVVANVYSCKSQTLHDAIVLIVSGDIGDIGHFLHPSNASSFCQVVQNLEEACFWSAPPLVDATGCLVRLLDDIDNKAGLSDQSRAVMREAAEHLERAIDTPGWSNWMPHGVAIPIYIPSLPQEVKVAWSQSMGHDTDWIDAMSALQIKEMNICGATLEDIVIVGMKSLNSKRQEASTDLDKATAAAEKKQTRARKLGLVAAVTAASQKSSSITPKRTSSKKTAKIDKALDQAARNAQIAINADAMAGLAQPLPTVLKAKTRSPKMNYILETIDSSPLDDRFIIFGGKQMLLQCLEVLEFFDISWYVSCHQS
jgi:hypothetical protein